MRLEFVVNGETDSFQPSEDDKADIEALVVLPQIGDTISYFFGDVRTKFKVVDRNFEIDPGGSVVTLFLKRAPDGGRSIMEALPA